MIRLGRISVDVPVDELLDGLDDEQLVDEIKRRKIERKVGPLDTTALEVLRDVVTELHNEAGHAGPLHSCPFPLCCDAQKVLRLTGKGESLAISERLALDVGAPAKGAL